MQSIAQREVKHSPTVTTFHSHKRTTWNSVLLRKHVVPAFFCFTARTRNLHNVTDTCRSSCSARNGILSIFSSSAQSCSDVASPLRPTQCAHSHNEVVPPEGAPRELLQKWNKNVIMPKRIHEYHDYLSYIHHQLSLTAVQPVSGFFNKRTMLVALRLASRWFLRARPFSDYHVALEPHEFTSSTCHPPLYPRVPLAAPLSLVLILAISASATHTLLLWLLPCVLHPLEPLGLNPARL